MRNINTIVASIMAGNGMTYHGLALVARAFGEDHVDVTCYLPSHGKRNSIPVRMMALAFALTIPRDMRPSGN